MVQNATSLSPQQIEYVNYVALGRRGSDGRKLSMEAFAKSIEVNRVTLYRWQDDIPEFWEMVRLRINSALVEYMPEVINAMRKKALDGDVAAAKLLMNQADILKALPKTSLDIETQQHLSVEVVSYA